VKLIVFILLVYVSVFILAYFHSWQLFTGLAALTLILGATKVRNRFFSLALMLTSFLGSLYLLGWLTNEANGSLVVNKLLNLGMGKLLVDILFATSLIVAIIMWVTLFLVGLFAAMCVVSGPPDPKLPIFTCH
jgi:signal transduction histidine kinase